MTPQTPEHTDPSWGTGERSAGSGEQGVQDPPFHSGEPGAQSLSGWGSLKLRVPRRPALQGPPSP